MIQSTHPDIDFDWPQILKGRQDAAPERSRQDPSSGRGERTGRSNEKPDRRGRPDASRRPDRRGAAPETSDPTPMSPPVQPRIAEPDTSAIETGPAADRLGPVGLHKLRARHAEIVSRIQARVEDETRRAELNALAARLNPDGWGNDEAVVAGLEGYEATYDALKNAIGGRRKPPAPADEPGPDAAEPGGSTVADGSE